MCKTGYRRWALGVGLWANKQHHNLILPLPWWERKPAVMEKLWTAGEERGISYHPPLCPLSFGVAQDLEPVERPSREG